MPEEPWSFRTARGTVTVREDGIGIRSTPGRFLAGQRARWRHGGVRDRARVTADVAVPPLLLSIVAVQLYTAGQVVPDASSVLLTVVTAVAALSSASRFWRKYVRETTIPRSDVETVVVDEESETITIERTPGDGPLSTVRPDDTETTLAFPTTDDRREALEVFRLRGIPVETRREREPGPTTYRVETRKGACFCERCGSQVSPADAACPACDYRLRVEERTESGRGRPGRIERGRETERNTAR